MIQSATGLILRTRPLTETSLIVHWLTPDFGRMATVAKGARRAKSPFLGRLDLFYLADFSFSRSRRSDLHALREVSLRDTQSCASPGHPPVAPGRLCRHVDREGHGNGDAAARRL